MEDYIDFDRQDIGQASLDEALCCLERIQENTHMWKYAIISIHNALQSYLSIALRGTSGIETWKRPHAKKWLKAYEDNENLPDVQLDYFLELYDKLFPSKSDAERSLIKCLNDIRNEFIHFNSDSFSVHRSSMMKAFEQALLDIKETPNLSKGIFFYNDEQQQKFIETCNSITILQEKLNKSNQ